VEFLSKSQNVNTLSLLLFFSGFTDYLFEGEEFYLCSHKKKNNFMPLSNLVLKKRTVSPKKATPAQTKNTLQSI